MGLEESQVLWVRSSFGCVADKRTTWNVKMMECWNKGFKAEIQLQVTNDNQNVCRYRPHQSIIPIFHYSNGFFWNVMPRKSGNRCRNLGISSTSFGSVRITIHNHSGSEHETDGDTHEKNEDVVYEHFLSPIKYRLGSSCDSRDSRGKRGPYPGFCQQSGLFFQFPKIGSKPFSG